MSVSVGPCDRNFHAWCVWLSDRFCVQHSSFLEITRTWCTCVHLCMHASMCTHTHTCMHPCAHTHTHTHVHMHTCDTHTHTHTHTQVCARTHTHTHTREGHHLQSWNGFVSPLEEAIDGCWHRLHGRDVVACNRSMLVAPSKIMH